VRTATRTGRSASNWAAVRVLCIRNQRSAPRWIRLGPAQLRRRARTAVTHNPRLCVLRRGQSGARRARPLGAMNRSVNNPKRTIAVNPKFITRSGRLFLDRKTGSEPNAPLDDRAGHGSAIKGAQRARIVLCTVTRRARARRKAARPWANECIDGDPAWLNAFSCPIHCYDPKTLEQG